MINDASKTEGFKFTEKSLDSAGFVVRLCIAGVGGALRPGEGPYSAGFAPGGGEGCRAGQG